MIFINNMPDPNTKYINTAFLSHNSTWNDWFKFKTSYFLIVFDNNGIKYDVGELKIGDANLELGIDSGNSGVPSIPNKFERLGENFFSLGQNENYYEVLYQLPEDLKNEILLALRDCANDNSIFNRYRNSPVMIDSLLRYLSDATVTNKFKNIINGDVQLTRFDFSYTFPKVYEEIEPQKLDFIVTPNSLPSTNIHVIIGRNGVGKTSLFRKIVLAMRGEEPIKNGKLEINSQTGEKFANLISVSFSAFEAFNPLSQEEKMQNGTIKYNYVGLQKPNDGTDKKLPTKNSYELAIDFMNSYDKCKFGPRLERWENSIKELYTDPIFENIDIINKIETADNEEIIKIFDKQLSSGHKIVLLTITKLVELVDEKSLLLIDEPEGHLHPPLYAAFTQALSYLLKKRNGVALVATHSPVILQEVTKENVWILSREGKIATATRPTIETYGENIGTLTNEVFKLEVTHSGFHKRIKKEVELCEDYEEFKVRFNNQLGSEAKAIAQSLFYIKNN